MGVYIYCPRKSQGALELVQGLGAKRLRRFDGVSFWQKHRPIELAENDIVVCWGASLPEMDGVRILNALEKPINKVDEYKRFVTKGVPTVSVATADGNRVNAQEYLDAGYVARSKVHQGGHDLLFKTGTLDYWSKKLVLKREYRIHSFAGRSIRAGEKVVRDGFTLLEDETQWKPDANLAHPWIRSFDGGWRIKYDGFTSTAKMRALAHKAVAALDLTFGAVDIGENSLGQLIVLEVNTAPGLEGGSIQAYIRALTKWIENTPAEEGEE